MNVKRKVILLDDQPIKAEYLQVSTIQKKTASGPHRSTNKAQMTNDTTITNKAKMIPAALSKAIQDLQIDANSKTIWTATRQGESYGFKAVNRREDSPEPDVRAFHTAKEADVPTVICTIQKPPPTANELKLMCENLERIYNLERGR